MTRRPRLAEWIALLLWTAIPSVYAVVARLWTPTPTRREEIRRGN